MTEEEAEKLLAEGIKTRSALRLEKKLRIPCNRLESILREQGFSEKTPIDVLSIDIEGGEYEVIQTFPWKEWNVRVVLIEVDKPGNAFKIRNFFRDVGLYRNPYRIDLHHPDDIYVRKDVPVNDLDSFQVGCEESCRRITQCTSWNEKERECEK